MKDWLSMEVFIFSIGYEKDMQQWKMQDCSSVPEFWKSCGSAAGKKCCLCGLIRNPVSCTFRCGDAVS